MKEKNNIEIPNYKTIKILNMNLLFSFSFLIFSLYFLISYLDPLNDLYHFFGYLICFFLINLLGITPLISTYFKNKIGIEKKFKIGKFLYQFKFRNESNYILSIISKILIIIFILIIISLFHNFFKSQSFIFIIHIIQIFGFILLLFWVILVFNWSYIWTYENGIGFFKIFNELIFHYDEINKIELYNNYFKLILIDNNFHYLLFGKEYYDDIFAILKKDIPKKIEIQIIK